MSAPLLGRPTGSRRSVALVVAGTCAVLAMVGVVFVMGASPRPNVLLQQSPQYILAAQAQPYQMQPMMMQPGQPMMQPMMQQPMYYMPVAQQGLAAAPQPVAQPVVYYYVPANQAQLAYQMLPGNASAGAGNSSSAGGEAAAEPEFQCTVANLVAESKTVQTDWDKCKTNPHYEEPNKDAKRRLMEWVWEPQSGEARSSRPSHGPGSYEMVLRRRRSALAQQMLNGTAGGNASGAGGTEATDDSMEDCMKDALGEACDHLSGCDDKVCTHYYNEPEIEALCGMCGMGNANAFGCFATNSQTNVAGKGTVSIDTIEIGDEVLSASGDYSRVYFIHDHKEVSSTVRISTEKDVMELTPIHYLPVYTEECGNSYCADAKLVRAESVKAGDRVYVAGGSAQVTAVTKGQSHVRYVVTESGSIVVNGVVASVYSTAAGALETLPFRLMDMLFKGSLQAAPVAAALRTILESPMLQGVEAVVNSVAWAKPAPSTRAFAATPISF